jgi:hypothetical protein
MSKFRQMEAFMSKQVMRFIMLFVVLALCFTVLAAFAKSAPSGDAKITTPPPFNYGGHYPGCITEQLGKLIGVRAYAGHGMTKAGQEGVQIEAIAPKGPAEKIGMKAGDIITAANDISATCPMSLLQTLQAADKTKKIVLTADRNGKTVKLTFAAKALLPKDKPVKPAADPNKPAPK